MTATNPRDQIRRLEELMADVAAVALARYRRIDDDLGPLGGDLWMLRNWAADHLLDPSLTGRLDAASQAVVDLEIAVEAVRDVASMLPIRGLEFGEDQP